MAQQIITQPCGLDGCDRVLVYAYKGWGRKRSYCSDACRKAAKTAQDASRDRHGERQRIRANRRVRRCRNALRGISDYEIGEGRLTVRGRESSLRAGPTGPSEGSTGDIHMPDVSDHDWFKSHPGWDLDL